MGLRQQHWGGCSAQEWCSERRPVASIEACGKVITKDRSRSGGNFSSGSLM